MMGLDRPVAVGSGHRRGAVRMQDGLTDWE
jgi:hypothetical protein